MMSSAIIVHCRSVLVLGALLCAGCTSIQTKTPDGKPVSMSEADFAVYFERVFRHHNTVVNESLFASSGLMKASDPVTGAEVKMDNACQPLNEVASASATGQSPDFWTKMKLVDAVPECEAATRQMEQLITTN